MNAFYSYPDPGNLGSMDMYIFSHLCSYQSIISVVPIELDIIVLQLLISRDICAIGPPFRILDWTCFHGIRLCEIFILN